MKRTYKPVLFTATIALMGATLAGCGGDGSGAPADASKTDFCKAMGSVFEGMTPDDVENMTPEKGMDRLRDWADEMEKTGTPEDISDDARAGFEKTIEMVRDLPDDATEKDFDKADDDMSKTEEKNSEAFDDYTMKTCPDLGGDMGSAE